MWSRQDKGNWIDVLGGLLVAINTLFHFLSTVARVSFSVWIRESSKCYKCDCNVNVSPAISLRLLSELVSFRLKSIKAVLRKLVNFKSHNYQAAIFFRKHSLWILYSNCIKDEFIAFYTAQYLILPIISLYNWLQQ